MLQLLLFTPLSSAVYLVIYRSGQLEKTNNILNEKRTSRQHPSLSLLVGLCVFYRAKSRSCQTCLHAVSLSFFFYCHEEASMFFLFYCLWSASVLCLSCLVMLDLASLVLSKYFNGSTSSQRTTAQASLVYAAAFFLFLSPLLSLSSSSLAAVAIAGFPSHTRLKCLAALDNCLFPRLHARDRGLAMPLAYTRTSASRWPAPSVPQLCATPPPCLSSSSSAVAVRGRRARLTAPVVTPSARA